jgi:hypothetical protein
VRYTITWTETKTYRTEVDIHDDELTAWARQTPDVRTLAPEGESVTREDLSRLLKNNRHFRDRLIQMYTNATRLLHPKRSQIVQAEGQRITAIHRQEE